MVLTLSFALFYNPFMILFGYFTASAMGFAPSKKVFRVLLCLLVIMLGTFIFLNINQLTLPNLVNIIPMFILMLITPFGMRNFNQKDVKEPIKRSKRTN